MVSVRERERERRPSAVTCAIVPSNRWQATSRQGRPRVRAGAGRRVRQSRALPRYGSTARVIPAATSSAASAPLLSVSTNAAVSGTSAAAASAGSDGRMRGRSTRWRRRFRAQRGSPSRSRSQPGRRAGDPRTGSGTRVGRRSRLERPTSETATMPASTPPIAPFRERRRTATRPAASTVRYSTPRSTSSAARPA